MVFRVIQVFFSAGESARHAVFGPLCCFCSKLLPAPAGGTADELSRVELEDKINSRE
jgi:hypothetical protein